METLFLASMRVQAPLTQVLRGLGREHWQVEKRDMGWRVLTDISAGVLSDATKSVSRAYINNFQDKSKQTAIDMFLVMILFVVFSMVFIRMAGQGNLSNQRFVTIYDPIHDTVREALERRSAAVALLREFAFNFIPE